MKHLFKNRIASVVVAMFVGGLIVWLAMPQDSGRIENPNTIEAEGEHSHETIWTCSMHPQIRQMEPGKCPICGMDLIPLDADDVEQTPTAIRMSATAIQLADVETAVVGTGRPEKSLRLNGKIIADQRRTYSQTSHIPGRIEELRIDFTGERVQAGEVLARVYSPSLITAQNELMQARKIKDSQPSLYEAARRKLQNWKLTDTQIKSIEEAGAVMENFPINADRSGFVVEKMVELGDYVDRGQTLYRIADLSRVWVMFDIYESDMPWIEKGDQMEFTVASLPGKQFSGRIDYVDPVLDPKTRVAEARVEINNTDGALRPGMFASGTVSATLERDFDKLIIPKTAVMWTGKRSLVYVKLPADDVTEFSMRQIVLGPSLGDGYIVEEGLYPGEVIAVNGTFSIDAAAQLAGKPSMMSQDYESAIPGNISQDESGTGDGRAVRNLKYTEIAIDEKVKETLRPLIDSYLEIKNALVDDNMTAAKTAVLRMENILINIPEPLFIGETRQIWIGQSETLKEAISKAAAAEDIEGIRQPFSEISKRMVDVTEIFKPYLRPLYVQFCPMANDNKGAEWLSLKKEVKNPYFGEAMLECGEVKFSIE